MLKQNWMRPAMWLASVALVLISGTVLRAQEAFRNVFVETRLVESSNYWLGVGCHPCDAALRAHLQLDDQGLLVREVVADAPAAKGGIKVHDVLLAVGDKKLGKLDDLIQAVDENGDKELTVQLIREGKKMALKIKPAKRPAGPDARRVRDDAKKHLERLNQLLQDDKFNRPLQWQRIRPGVVRQRVEIRRSLPKGTSVEIRKQGDEPAKIIVKQGDKKWETTEKDLDKLPKDVRDYVRRMVRPGAVFTPQGNIELDFTIPKSFPRSPVEKRLDDLTDEVKQLRKAIEKLTREGT